MDRLGATLDEQLEKQGLLFAAPPSVGQDVGVAEHVHSCKTCQRTKVDHGGPRGLLNPLPLPSRRGVMIG